jgi:hypothetical protein
MRGRHERARGQRARQDTRGSEAAGQPANAGQGRQHTPAKHEASVNQHKHEPLPASHQAGQGEPAGHDEHPSRPAAPGQAVRDMMGGPQPQGDVPDAPATQIAAVDSEGDQAGPVRYVANAVPGKPDGEVDTRP